MNDYYTDLRRKKKKKILNYIFIIFSFALIITDIKNKKILDNVRKTIIDINSPLLSVVSTPFTTIKKFMYSVSELNNLTKENKELKKKLEKTQIIENRYEQALRENESFRRILKYTPIINKEFVTAKIIGNSYRNFTNVIIVNRGEDSGIRKDMTVIAKNNLIGRTVSVSKNSARILLIDDFLSNIPVSIEDTAQNAILNGNGNELPTLSFIKDLNKIKIGQKIKTTGNGGIFLPNTPIGKIYKITKDEIQVSLYVDPNQQNYVQILKFNYVNLK